jgi:trans-aconitate 2-methyltransferase
VQWDPEQYTRYADERGRPFRDLIARIDCPAPRRVLDFGCGPGNLMPVLTQRWPGAVVEGIDSSAEMIASAAGYASPAVSFRVADITTETLPADADVVVSNAVLQWVPSHRELLQGWAARLPPGGWLAFQVPANFGAPGHTLMRELASSPRWEQALAGVLRHHDAVSEPSDYATLLLDAGLRVDVWETTYLHLLAGPDPVLEWLRGTGLRPVLGALSPEDAVEFEAAFATLLRGAYPASAHGTLMPYRRIFAVGHRP